MPAEHPERTPEREEVPLTGLAAGHSVAEMAKVIEIARQHAYRLLGQAEGRLAALQEEHDSSPGPRRRPR